MILVSLAFLVCAGMSPSAGAPASCDVVANSLSNELSASSMAMEPEGRRQAIYDRATTAGARCGNSEALAYVRLRASELTTERATSDDPRMKAFRLLAHELSKQFPASARIATICARSEGSVDRARQAVAIDPRYAPAQVALANALVDSGDVAKAKTVMDGLKGLANLDDGFTVLARVRWAEGDAKGTIDAASKELKGRDAIGVEPGGGDAQAIAKAHELLGLAYAKQGKPEKAAPHLVLVEQTSASAREAIRDASPALQNAIAKARRHIAGGK
jgi:tetratricopeptide (TPR) repeat protein